MREDTHRRKKKSNISRHVNIFIPVKFQKVQLCKHFYPIKHATFNICEDGDLNLELKKKQKNKRY